MRRRRAGRHRLHLFAAFRTYPPVSLQLLPALRARVSDLRSLRNRSTFWRVRRYLGHANISITLDRYGHLMPGNEAEARALLGAYLDREGG
jgi:integrase